MTQTNYRTAVHYLHNNIILCNEIERLDPSIIENARWDWCDEDDNYTEIYQWFITDCTEGDVEFFNKHFPSILFTYSNLLDKFILAVDHYGTA